MTTGIEPAAPPAPEAAHEVLRRLFLTLFLRGRSSRGLQKSSAPRSVGSKLALTLAVHAAVGLAAVAFWGKSILALSVFLHATTFVFLGLFVAASCGEMLFNDLEADILLHRPISARALLRAKVRVLVEVSLWLSVALNLASFVVGATMPGGSWLFPVAHALSMTLEALFCTGCVVVVYQLCLRWFGRERLDGLMTTAQVIVAICTILAGQLVPQLLRLFAGRLDLALDTWWLALLPPLWFAAFDDALAGANGASSWALAGIGLVATAGVLAAAFGKLSSDYQRGLQSLNETRTLSRQAQPARRWLDHLAALPPLSWWLRDSVSRASFLLTAAYLIRDRDVKLRVYPSLAPMLVMPIVFLLRPGDGIGGGFGMAFAGCFFGLTPMLALSVMRYSQQWQASDIFRVAPIAGPAQLCHGARRAVLLLLGLPLLALFGVLALATSDRPSELLLAVPGVLALPVYVLVPCIGGSAVPLSLPSEEAKAAGRGMLLLGAMLLSMIVSGLGMWARSAGWFWQFVLVEALVVVASYVVIRRGLSSARWSSLE
jgi:ABC-2 type transport system permease protein